MKDVAVVALLSAFAAPSFAAAANAQSWFRVAPEPAQRAAPGMVFDPSTRRLFVFGGKTTEFLDAGSTAVRVGTRWNELDVVSPPPRWGCGIATDPLRSRVVLFGGQQTLGGRLADLYEWDGSTWSAQSPPSVPACAEPVLCWHGGTGAVVLYAAGSATGPGRQTWTWNGAVWTQLAPPLDAGLRRGHSMVYDAARDRIVLFGGLGPGNVPLGGTFEWNGTTWLPRNTGAEPPPGTGLMAYDAARQRTVRYGQGTYVYDGITWVQAQPAHQPGAHFGYAMAYDVGTQRVVMHGGPERLQGAWRHDTWEWDGQDWTQVDVGEGPGMRNDVRMAIEPGSGRALLHGGFHTFVPLTDTWRVGADGWEQVAIVGYQPPLRDAVLAGDGARVLAFPAGGVAPRTWLLADGVWSQHTLSFEPSARVGHAMAHDPMRDVVVLFGGVDANSNTLADTWEWNGTTWLPGATTGPTARGSHALAADACGGGVLLFGGFGAGGLLGDTWRLSATGWQQVATSGPGARWGHAMAADHGRGVVVLSMGYTATTVPSDHWEWDGLSWTFVGNVPPARSWAMTDSRRGPVLVLDGLAYELAPPAARATEFGLGCPGSRGTPRLAAGGLPLLGTNALQSVLDEALPNTFAALIGDLTSPGPGPQCTVLVTNPITLALGVTSAAGTLRWQASLPDDPVFRGVVLYEQAVVFDPGAGLFGVAALSNGLELRIDW